MLYPVELMAVKKKTSYYWSMGHAVVSAIWASTQVNLVMVSRALSNATSNVVFIKKLLPIDNTHRVVIEIILTPKPRSHESRFFRDNDG